MKTADPNFTGYTVFPTQSRNQFRGPKYVDFDMSLFKTFQIKEGLNLGIGATAFDVFNHPNFGLPDYYLGDPTFGQIQNMQGTPTSPYGVASGSTLQCASCNYRQSSPSRSRRQICDRPLMRIMLPRGIGSLDTGRAELDFPCIREHFPQSAPNNLSFLPAHNCTPGQVACPSNQ